MFYIAKKFIGHAGTTVRPGEAFEADSQDDKINWLLSQDAIVPATPAFATEEPENENDDQEDAGDIIDQMAGTDVDTEEAEEEETPEEIPEIDVLESIVTAEEEVPAKKNGRKKS